MQQRTIADELEAKKREWAEQQRSHQNSLRIVQQAQQQSSLDSESLSGSESDTESEYQHVSARNTTHIRYKNQTPRVRRHIVNRLTLDKDNRSSNIMLVFLKEFRRREDQIKIE